jgi:AcrR family transcriptional regulator
MPAKPTKRPKPSNPAKPDAKRKPRADALRNRERILEVAKQAFTRHGAATSLDDVAKQAKVGPGTLYRHFPTREALLEAVYKTEVAKLAAAQQKFADTLSPVEALRAWMMLFIDYIAAKKIIAPALAALVGPHPKFVEACYAQVHQAVRALVKRAIDSGDLRPDLDAVDLLRALVGVSSMSTGDDWKQSAARLVDILIAGSKPAH